MPSLLALTVDLLVLAGLTGLGLLMTRILLGRPSLLESVSLAFPLGSGVFTWLLFLLSWAGIGLVRWTVLLAYALVLLLLFWLSRRQSRGWSNDEGGSAAGSDDGLPQRVLMFSLLLFLAIMGPLAVGQAHSRWDGAAGWIIKGYGIALEGDIRAGQTWGAWGLSYPLNIPLQVTLFRLFSWDQMPGSMMIFPIYGASMAAGLYRFWRRQGVGGWLGLLGAGLLLTNPLVMLHSSIPYANLPTTVLIVLGTCWMVEGLADDRHASVVVGSLLFGLAAWTRAEALSYGLFVLPALWILFQTRGRRWKMAVAAILPFVILVGSWAAFGWTAVEQSHLGRAMYGVLPKLRAGEFRLFELYLIPRLLSKRAVQPETWGYLFPIAGLLCLFGFPRLLRRAATTQQLAWLLATGIISAVPVGIFYVRAFTRQSGFVALLNRSFDRAFLPGAVMLLALGFLLAFGRSKEEERTGGDEAGVAVIRP